MSLVEGTVITSAPWEPVAIAAKLGYVLSGSTVVMVDDENDDSVNLTATHVLKLESTVTQQESLTPTLRRFWGYESLGIRDQSVSLYDKFVGEVEFVKGRYQVRLPFKEDHERYPDNCPVQVKARISAETSEISKH